MKNFLVKGNHLAFFPAKVLGFCCTSYHSDTATFKKNRLLFIYHRSVYIIICFVGISIVAALLLLVPMLINTTIEKKRGIVQERMLWGTNFVQLCLGIWTTYHNQAVNEAVAESILNDVVKCNRKLIKLSKEGITSNKTYKSFVIARVLTTVLDIWFTLKRPWQLGDITLENSYIFILYKLILAALFFEWHFIQTQMTTTYETLNHLVQHSDNNLRAKDYRVMSKICTRIFKIKRASTIYYGQFAMVSFASLIRTVAMSFETFSTILTTMRFKKKRMPLFVGALKVLGVSIMVPVVDIVMFCTMAEYIAAEAEKFRWSLLISECQVKKEPQVQQNIEMIMRQAHWEDLRWMTIIGRHVTRECCWVLITEAISWTIILLLYDPNNYVIATMAYSASDRCQIGVYIMAFSVFVYLALVHKTFLSLYKFLRSEMGLA